MLLRLFSFNFDRIGLEIQFQRPLISAFKYQYSAKTALTVSLGMADIGQEPLRPLVSSHTFELTLVR